jgi:hypothetical protein
MYHGSLLDFDVVTDDSRANDDHVGINADTISKEHRPDDPRIARNPARILRCMPVVAAM